MRLQKSSWALQRLCASFHFYGAAWHWRELFKLSSSGSLAVICPHLFYGSAVFFFAFFLSFIIKLDPPALSDDKKPRGIISAFLVCFFLLQKATKSTSAYKTTLSLIKKKTKLIQKAQTNLTVLFYNFSHAFDVRSLTKNIQILDISVDLSDHNLFFFGSSPSLS